MTTDCMMLEAAADHGEHPHCQTCGEPINASEDFDFRYGEFRCEACSRNLLEEADIWAVERCRVLDPDACCRDGLSDDERFRETNYHELMAQFDGTSIRGVIYREMIEQRMVQLVEELLQEHDLNPPTRPWQEEGF